MKRFTALILVLVMVCTGVLISCADNKNGGPPAGTNAGGTTAPSTQGGGTDAPEETTDPSEYVYTPDPEAKHAGMVGFGTLGASVDFFPVTITNQKDNHELAKEEYTAADPLANWTLAAAVGGDWDKDKADFTVVDRKDKKTDVKAVAFSDTDATGVMAYFGEPTWNNIKYAVKCMIHDIGDGVVFYFCVQDDKNYNELIVGANGGESIVLNSVVNGEVKKEGEMPFSLSGINLEVAEGKDPDVIPMSINYNKETIDLFVNGKRMFVMYGTLDPMYGGVGLGSWATKNSFDNIVVKSNVDGKVLYENDFSDPNTINDFMPKAYSGGSSSQAASITGDWQTNWVVTDDTAEGSDKGSILQNTATYEGNVLVLKQSLGNKEWSNITFSFDARIDVANEGWLVYCGIVDDNNYIMWNVGGWANSTTVFEPTSGGSKNTLTKITTKYDVGEWYHFDIVIHEQYIECFIDDVLIQTYSAL